MTVAELIKELSTMNPDREVWVRIPDKIEDNTDFPIEGAVIDQESPACFIVG